jgi:peptide/nickel transport system substrate-binding protein
VYRWIKTPKAIIFTSLMLGLLFAVACGTSAPATTEPTAPPTTAPAAGAAAVPTPQASPTPTGGAVACGGDPTPTPYACAAPALIQELDERFPLPPPVPPWPPRRGGVLHIPTSVLRDLDPTSDYGTEMLLIYDQLLEWEATWYFPEVQRIPTIRNNLVESWEMVDPATWDFHLKQGVTFHDRPPVNGREMTAEDVKYSYELLRTKPGWSLAATSVESVEVLDTYTARFNLKFALAEFPTLHTNGFAPAIVPREAVEAPGGLLENPIGTGAFILEEFVPGEGALLVRNPNYHLSLKGEQLPFVDAVRLIFTRDAATQTALFRTQQVDLLRPPTLDSLYQILDTVPDAWLYRVPSFMWGAYTLLLNLDEEPFNDVRVRRAISMAINREVVKEVINRGDASLIGPFPWALAGFTERADYTYENLGPYYEYNPEKARELLAEAGYPDGFETTIELAEYRGYAFEDFAVLVAKFLSDIGIRAELKQLDTATWTTKRRGGEPFDGILAALTPSGSGPTDWHWVYLPYHSTSGPTVNIGSIYDAQVDELLNQWRETPAEEQLAIQKQLWERLTDQMYRVQVIVPPHYRLTQSYVHAGGNPYCWYIGFCSYEAKTTWLTENAPVRGFERFSQ